MCVCIRTYICSVYMCKTQLQVYGRPHTYGTMWNNATSACVPYPHPTHIYIYIHMHIRTLYIDPYLPLPSACMADHMTVRWPLTAVRVHPLLMHARIIEHQAKMQKLQNCVRKLYIQRKQESLQLLLHVWIVGWATTKRAMHMHMCHTMQMPTDYTV